MPSNYRSMRNAAAGALAATAARDGYRTAIRYGSKMLKRGNRSTKYRPRSLVYRNPVYSTSTKRHNADKLAGSVSSNVLNTVGVTSIEQGTAINQRERQLVQLRGFKIHYVARNLVGLPVYNRLALVRFKYRSDAGTSPDIDTDFFRGQLSKRAIPFTSVANAQHLYDYSINTDKFEVLWDHKFILYGNNLPGTAEEAAFTKFVDKFVPCNKVIHYDDTTSFSDNDGIYLIHWCAAYNNNTITPVTGQVYTRGHVTTFFQDVH